MRPCNQCRRPVDNDIFVCQDCIEKNAQNSEPLPRQISANLSAPTSGSRKPTDIRDEDGKISGKSKLILALVFLTPVALGAFVGGALTQSMEGAVGGGMVGALLGARLLEMSLY